MHRSASRCGDKRRSSIAFPRRLRTRPIDPRCGTHPVKLVRIDPHPPTQTLSPTCHYGEKPMTTIVMALYSDANQAQQAANDLGKSGFRKEDIQVFKADGQAGDAIKGKLSGWS